MSPLGRPWLPRWIEALVPRAHRDEWLGDLIERWHDERSHGASTGGASARLWLRIVRSAVDARLVHRRFADPTAGGAAHRRATGLARDARLALRMLRREPTSSGAAIGTLGLGVWAFVVGFALVDAALLTPLGYPGEDRLVLVGAGERALFGVSMPDHVELVEDSDLFEDAAAWQGWGVLLKPEDGAWTNVSGASATSDYLSMAGAEPALGRLFEPADDLLGHEPVAVISHQAWTSRFGGRPDVLGRRIEHENVSYAIVGVVEAGFRDPLPRLFGWSEPEVWRASPPNFEAMRSNRGQVSFWSFARLRPGVTLTQASADVRARAAELRGVDASQLGMDVLGYEDLLARRSRASLLLLLGAGLTVLAVSAANLANLLLTRGTARVQEMAVRSALGAGRGGLVRQLVVEGAVLGVVAAALGLVLTAATLGPVARAAASLLPAGTEVGVGSAAVLAAVVAAVAFAVVAALPPAIQSTRRTHLASLRQARRSARRSPLQTGLVVAQTAMAVVLVSASGLMLRTLWALADADLGFDPGVRSAWVALHADMFGDRADQTGTLERVLERLAGLPGVRGAAAITDLPMSGRVNSTNLRRPDVAQGAPLAQLQTLVRAVTPGYFDVMGVPLLAGRPLGADDRPGAPQVAVVNRDYADRHFPGEDPLGRTVLVRGVERSIVGVVGDVTEFSVGAPRDPVLYLTYQQEVEPWMRAGVYAVIRAEGEGPSLAALRAAASEVDARVPIGSPFPIADLVERNTVGHRFRALLATSLGALALALASVGLGGVTAYLVGRRTRELGVRVALGASPGRIAGMVLSGSGAVTALGIAIGLVASVATGKVLAGFLFGVPATDPVSLAVAAATLALTSMAAAALPTRRALRITPVDALRQE